MRWKRLSRKEKQDRKTLWHSWFAWHPVHVGEQTCWLEVVERRKRMTTKIVIRPSGAVGRDEDVVFEYRFITKETTNDAS